MAKKRQYKIKTVIMENGRKEYYPQVKNRFFWWWHGIDYKGECSGYSIAQNSESKCKERIEKHKNGNAKIKGTINVYGY